MKLNQALELFLLVDRAPQTRDTYRKFLVRFVDAIGPQRPLVLITPQDIDAYILDMRESRVKYATHRKRRPVNEPLAPSTIYKQIKMIKTFFKWCVERELLDLSPAGYLKNPRPHRPLGQGKACTDDELEQILAAAHFKPRDRALVLLLAESGCRADEAAGLRIQNLELSGQSAIIDGKGTRRRRIFYTEQAAEAILTWLDKRPGDVDHDYVFTSTRGHGRLTARAVSEIIRRLCKVAGLSRQVGAHSLRHRVGLTFARRRVAPRITQHYLGHENIKTTLEYYQDVDEDDLRAAGRLLAPGYDEDWQREAKENPAGKRLKPPHAAGL